jgi:phage terminase large subunit GpA-like protein
MSSLAKIVAGFLHARAAQKAGDRSEMHTWQNTTLGEPIELESGEGVDPDPLLLRREDYGDVDLPAGVCLLTMGVDTQDDRLELLVIGWGPGEESWIVDRDMLPGDPVGPEPWAMLDQFLAHEYLHESGQRLPITAACVDSAGHRTDAVYDYCHKTAARRVYATIGRDGNRPIIASPSQPRKRARAGRKVPLYTVGVDAAKALFMSRLKKTPPEEGESWDGYVHIPNTEWADEELIAQLTSERLVIRWRSGVSVTRWKRTRARNEMLDCAVLSIAALRIVRPDLELLAKRLVNQEEEEPKKKPNGDRKPFLGQRCRGFLRGR